MVSGWTSRGCVIAIFPTWTSSQKRIPRCRTWTLRWPILVAPGSELQRSVVSWTRRKGSKMAVVYNKRKGLPKRQQKVWHVEMSQMFKDVNFETVISLNFRILFLKDFKLMAKKKDDQKITTPAWPSGDDINRDLGRQWHFCNLQLFLDRNCLVHISGIVEHQSSAALVRVLDRSGQGARELRGSGWPFAVGFRFFKKIGDPKLV